ncbi:hypothetical protein EMIT036CA2_30033 [Chryseobacterium sp. IT-36CA2]
MNEYITPVKIATEGNRKRDITIIFNNKNKFYNDCPYSFPKSNLLIFKATFRTFFLIFVK